MTEELVIQARENMIGKTFTIGTRAGPLYTVFFFTFAGVAQPDQNYCALMCGIKEKWISVSIPDKPTAEWSNADWGQQAIKIVNRHLASYEGDRPTRFEREEVI
jgi:hypothetical protein